MNKLTLVALTAALLGGAATAAHADTLTDLVNGQDQLTLPGGMWLVNAQLEMNLDKGAAFKPVSISPDIWYGVNDQLTLGLVHSSLGRDGFMGDVGDAICLNGKDDGCEHPYRGLGIDARYGLKTGSFALALDGGVYAFDVDPFELGVKLGIDGLWHSGKIAIEFAPNLDIGLTNRDDGNKEYLQVPVTLVLSPTDEIAVLFQIGVRLPFSNTGDFYTIPASIGLQYRFDEDLNVGLAFSLPQLAGGSLVALTGFDARTLTLGGGYAF